MFRSHALTSLLVAIVACNRNVGPASRRDIVACVPLETALAEVIADCPDASEINSQIKGQSVMKFPGTFLGRLPIAIIALLTSTLVLVVGSLPRNDQQRIQLEALAEGSLAELASQ